MEAIRARRLLTDKPAGAYVISCQVTGSRLAQTIAPALKDLSLPILDARTSRRVAYEKAVGVGLTVLDLAGWEKAAQKSEALTQELVQQLS